MKRRIWAPAGLAILALLTIGAALGAPRGALAADPPRVQVLGFRQVDLAGQGRPDEAILDCACVTGHDQIRIFDSSGRMPVTTDWREALDLTAATWVIDVGARGRASLIIRFRTTKVSQVAELYDDVTGDGAVAYHLDKAQVVIDESPFWSLQIAAQPGWFLADGRPNLNISVLIDKPVPRSFEFIDAKTAAKYMPHDGKPDVAIDVVDSNHDGVADYVVARLLAPVPVALQVGRSRIWSNVGQTPAERPAAALLWPFLDFRPLVGSAASAIRFFDLVPRIDMDWAHAAIQGFTLPGYPIGAGYWLNSLAPLTFGRVNDVTYEAPHAWYDLAQAHDGTPDLNIRVFTQPDGPWQEIRYSWNQYNPHTLIWDYKLGLMGDVPISDVVTFPNFGLRMVPYARLPAWVTSQTWKLSTFVAREGRGQASSEGIYAWSPWSGVDSTAAQNPGPAVFQAASAYLAGASTSTPARFFTSIPEGFRGEYNLTVPLSTTLYFSPVDRRLHLKGAEHGLLNLGGGQTVTYENSGSGAYLDTWQTWDGPTLRGALYQAGPFLVFGGNGEVDVRQAGAADALFETLPPRDHAEWVAFGARVPDQRSVVAAGDLRAMLDQFPGATLRIPGATLREYRRTAANGFRFVVALPADSRISGGGLDGPLARGEYVVAYDGQFTREPLTPPVLGATVRAGPFTQGRPGPVAVALRNDGRQDVPSALLEVWAAAPGQPARRVLTQTVRLDAATPLIAMLQWAPPLAGDWTLTPRIQRVGATGQDFPATHVAVLPAAPPTAGALLAVSALPATQGLLALALLAIALLGMLIVWQQTRFTHEEL